MKVKYIGNYYKVSLLKDEIYEVIAMEDGAYRIIDETDEDYLYPPNEFEIVEE